MGVVMAIHRLTSKFSVSRQLFVKDEAIYYKFGMQIVRGEY